MFSFDKLKERSERFLSKISRQEKILFAQHLALMMKTGMGQIESLRVIQSQTQNKPFKQVLATVISNLENGQFLSSSLGRFPWIFENFFVNVIKLGEVSGTLPENLNYLAQEMRKKQQLESKVRSAMIYPVIILVATIGITSAIIFFVIPKILPIFASLKIQLPVSTRILIGSITFMRNYFFFVVFGFVFLIVLIIFLLRFPRVKNFFDRVFVALPMIGKITVYYNIVNITRTLAVLLKSGIKIIDAFTITADILNNSEYKKVLVEAVSRIQRGEAIYRHISEKEKLFPSTVSRIIEVGERTGNLDANLLYLAQFYEDELDEMFKNLSSVIEPALLVVMGGLVGFVAISIITPIYQVTQSISK